MNVGQDSGGILANAHCAAKGALNWMPSRDLSTDWSAWGVWEVWLWHHVVDGQVVATGDWGVWNAETGQNLALARHAFPSREYCERFCVLQNAGKPTRIVTPCGVSESCMSFEELHAKWGHLEREFYGVDGDVS
jgi:hypothetical protein